MDCSFLCVSLRRVGIPSNSILYPVLVLHIIHNLVDKSFFVLCWLFFSVIIHYRAFWGTVVWERRSLFVIKSVLLCWDQNSGCSNDWNTVEDSDFLKWRIWDHTLMVRNGLCFFGIYLLLASGVFCWRTQVVKGTLSEYMDCTGWNLVSFILWRQNVPYSVDDI